MGWDKPTGRGEREKKVIWEVDHRSKEMFYYSEGVRTPYTYSLMDYWNEICPSLYPIGRRLGLRKYTGIARHNSRSGAITIRNAVVKAFYY